MNLQNFTQEVISKAGFQVWHKIVNNSFEANTEISKMCQLSTSSSDVLTSLFVWDKTSQGFDYWQNIYNILEN
jgi:hypothetical protein